RAPSPRRPTPERTRSVSGFRRIVSPASLTVTIDDVIPICAGVTPVPRRGLPDRASGYRAVGVGPGARAGSVRHPPWEQIVDINPGEERTPGGEPEDAEPGDVLLLPSSVQRELEET